MSESPLLITRPRVPPYCVYLFVRVSASERKKERKKEKKERKRRCLSEKFDSAVDAFGRDDEKVGGIK